MVRNIMKFILPVVLLAVIVGVALSMDNAPEKHDSQGKTISVQVTEPTRAVVVTETTEAAEETEATVVPTTEETTQPTEPEPQNLLLTFVGDCTLGSNANTYYAEVGFVKTVGEDYAYPFANVIDYFENDDITFANLEGPLTDEGHPTTTGHTFRGPTDNVNILKDNSVEFVSVANNHVQDYGDIGYSSTLSTLKEAGISYVERDSSTIITLENGLSVGIYGAVYYKFDTADMKAEFAAMKEQGVDLIIFAPHWGIEGNYQPTAEQKKIGYAAIDAGANIVWGCHPHVLQPIEEYNGGIIYYSLGNFSFGGNTNPSDKDTALLQQEVTIDWEGNVTLGNCTIVPASISSIENGNNFQPTPYDQGTRGYERVLEKLNGTYTG